MWCDLIGLLPQCLRVLFQPPGGASSVIVGERSETSTRLGSFKQFSRIHDSKGSDQERLIERTIHLKPDISLWKLLLNVHSWSLYSSVINNVHLYYDTSRESEQRQIQSCEQRVCGEQLLSPTLPCVSIVWSDKTPPLHTRTHTLFCIQIWNLEVTFVINKFQATDVFIRRACRG